MNTTQKIIKMRDKKTAQIVLYTRILSAILNHTKINTVKAKYIAEATSKSPHEPFFILGMLLRKCKETSLCELKDVISKVDNAMNKNKPRYFVATSTFRPYDSKKWFKKGFIFMAIAEKDEVITILRNGIEIEAHISDFIEIKELPTKNEIKKGCFVSIVSFAFKSQKGNLTGLSSLFQKIKGFAF